MAAKKKTHKYSHTHVIHHKDGSHTVHHEAEDGKHKDYAVADHDSMMYGMMAHTSEPNEGEAQAQAGDHGVEAAEAQQAGLPAAPPPPAQGA